jgi:hypothetical protein
MDVDIVLWIVGQLFVGAALYGGIRVDIKNIHEKINHTDENVSDAHKRIDGILLRDKL